MQANKQTSRKDKLLKLEGYLTSRFGEDNIEVLDSGAIIKVTYPIQIETLGVIFDAIPDVVLSKVVYLKGRKQTIYEFYFTIDNKLTQLFNSIKG